MIRFSTYSIDNLMGVVLNDCASNLSSEDDESAKLQTNKKNKNLIMKVLQNSQHLQLRRIIH
jgi:hypothetical protein